MQHVTAVTPGLVIDGSRNPVAGALVVVTHPALGFVAFAVTDEAGFFVLDLPEIANLELALPGEGLAGIEVAAGVPMMIVVP